MSRRSMRLGALALATSFAASVLAVVPVAAAPGGLTVDPTSHAFGSIEVGDSDSVTFTVTPHDEFSGVFGTADLTGSGFSITSDTCSGQTVAPEETCEIEVTFTPTSEGLYDGYVSIDTLGDGGTITFDGSGSQSARTYVTRIDTDLESVGIGNQARYTARVSIDSEGPGSCVIVYRVWTRYPGEATWTLRYEGYDQEALVPLAQGNTRLKVTATHDSTVSDPVYVTVNRRVINIVPLHPKGNVWKRQRSYDSVGTDVLVASRDRAKARFTLPIAKGVALVVRERPGSAGYTIKANGTTIGTVAAGKKTRARRIAWEREWSKAARRVLNVTANGGPTALDAFVVTRADGHYSRKVKVGSADFRAAC